MLHYPLQPYMIIIIYLNCNFHFSQLSYGNKNNFASVMHFLGVLDLGFQSSCVWHICLIYVEVGIMTGNEARRFSTCLCESSLIFHLLKFLWIIRILWRVEIIERWVLQKIFLSLELVLWFFDVYEVMKEWWLGLTDWFSVWSCILWLWYD